MLRECEREINLQSLKQRDYLNKNTKLCVTGSRASWDGVVFKIGTALNVTRGRSPM